MGFRAINLASPSDTQRPPFLHLPSELRQQIYEYVFPEQHHFIALTGSGLRRVSRGNKCGDTYALPSACREIWNEALPIMYSKMHIDFEWWDERYYHLGKPIGPIEAFPPARWLVSISIDVTQGRDRSGEFLNNILARLLCSLDRAVLRNVRVTLQLPRYSYEELETLFSMLRMLPDCAELGHDIRKTRRARKSIHGISARWARGPDILGKHKDTMTVGRIWALGSQL
jgi:hypothetical protein